MKDFTINKIKQGLKNKEFSCKELVQGCFNAIKKDKLNDFIGLFEQEALNHAKDVDKKIASNKELNDFEGIPIAVKDNILIKNKKATAGSKILENYIASYDADAIEKLKKQGVIFLGKTNMDEFGMGASSETSYFGPVLNPHDKKRVPGGSSGGSAAAVSAHHCIFALGSDTGGSIRQPAAFCGVVGLKPSYGRISRNGLIALASSLDQIGVMANTVEDSAMIFNSIISKDEYDMTNLDSSSINISKIKDSIKGKTIAIPEDYYKSVIDKNIENAFSKILDKLKNIGVKFNKVDLSFIDDSLAVYYILQPAEASANLARYDGFRYGKAELDNKPIQLKGKCGDKMDLLETYFKNRSTSFGEEVKRRIMIGTYVLSKGYKDAYYNRARAVQNDIKFKFSEIFKKNCALIMPTTPSTAFKLKEKFNDPLTMYLSDIFTVSANIAGLPAISLPVHSDSLPIGIQVIGNFMDEQNILNIAWNIEELVST